MHRVFMRYLLLVMLALLGMVVFAGVSSFKGRWVVPLLCVLPLAAFAVRPELQRHARRALQRRHCSGGGGHPHRGRRQALDPAACAAMWTTEPPCTFVQIIHILGNHGHMKIFLQLC